MNPVMVGFGFGGEWGKSESRVFGKNQVELRRTRVLVKTGRASEKGITDTCFMANHGPILLGLRAGKQVLDGSLE